MSDLVAVACVVDSSLALASEWTQLLQEYIHPMLRRLAELHAKSAFRIGFVSYGTADTRPTPLLEKVFFGQAKVVLRDFKDYPGKLGIGTTGSGGSRGMAALEGLVAALELFDVLLDSTEINASYIFHVAAAPPDSAERPVWNMAPTLDDVSWESLPHELQKREISYSNILLQKLPKFSELYTSVAAETSQKPWFTVRPQHTLHLSAFPASSKKGLKRPNEGNTAPDRSPETKRTRVQSHPTSDPSPKVANSVPPPPSVNPAPQPSSTMNQRFDPGLLQRMEERMRQMQQAVLQKQQQYQAHRQAGREQEAAAANSDFLTMMKAYKQLMAVIQRARAGQGHLPQSRSQPAALDANDGATAGQRPDGPPETKEGIGLQTSASLPQALHTMPTANQSFESTSMTMLDQIAPPSVFQQSSSQTQRSRPAALPNPAGQMSHMVEQQRNRTPLPPQPQPQPTGQQLSHTQGPMAGTSSQQQSHPPLGQVVWEGILSWGVGLDPNGRHLQAHASILTPQQAHGELLRTMNWPNNIGLIPSEDRAVPIFVLQEWLKRFQNQTCVIYVTAQIQGADGAANVENLSNLSRTLQEKNIYAIATFKSATLPEKRVLLFSAKGGHLAGAFFLTPGGMPELPKPEICGFNLATIPPPLAIVLSKLSPAQQTAMNSVPMENRVTALESYLQRQQQQLKIQQQQHQQVQQQVQKAQAAMQIYPQPPPLQQPAHKPGGPIIINPFLGGRPPPIGVALSDAIGGGPSQSPIPNLMTDTNVMGSQGVPGMMHRRTPSTGSMGGGTGLPNVSFEMMQSFMQRNPEGSGGGSGMGS